MPDTKISELTSVTTPSTTDEFPVNQGAVSKKVTLNQIPATAVRMKAGSNARYTRLN